MSNSNLVTYRVLKQNNVSRGGKSIKYILPHCYVGQVTAKRGVDSFNARTDGASVHYLAGYNFGDIGQQVDEAYKPGTTGGDKTLKTPYGTFTGRQIDFESVTIEIACDASAPYAITEGAFANVVNLMADIAMRNGLGLLKWKANPQLVGNPEEQNVLVHRWFASKSCPGDFIYNRLGEICEKANEVIRTGKWYEPAPIPTPTPSQIAQPTVKSGSTGENARLLQKNLNAFGYGLTEDGIFGTKSVNALKGWQFAAFNDKTQADGIFGAKSSAKMGELLKK